MLTIRENLLETINGGNPDRFVKQYEFLAMMGGDPIGRNSGRPTKPGETVANSWGIINTWKEGQVSSFPLHDEEHVLVKDVTKWKDVVKAPNVLYPADDWKDAIASSESIDRNEYFATLMVAPGVFEQCHHLMSIGVALQNLFVEPEAMHELIDYLTDYELAIAEQHIKYYKPDALFHHDDWGTHISTFMSPEMWHEFFYPAYKKIYGYYKENGVNLIVHHSDSFAATLVPQMIDVGIDIFQGCTTTNNVPALVKEFGGRISFMGDLDNGVLDRANMSRETIKEHVERACRNNGKHYFIPCLVRGGPGTLYEGVYEAVNEEIDRMSKEMF